MRSVQCPIFHLEQLALHRLDLDEEHVRIRRRIAKHQAMTLEAVDRRQRQSLAGEHRPGSHGDHHDICLQRLAVYGNARDPSTIAR